MESQIKMLNKTSVIIPFYNNVPYIKEAISSVLLQTCQPKEIIVVNDGSTKTASEFLDTFSEHVTIINHDRNKGISQARNTGAKHSTGIYLTFLDADDLWEPDKLEVQQNLLDKSPSITGCHTGVYVFSKNKKIIETCNAKPKILSLKNMAFGNHVVPSSFMIRSTSFHNIGGFDPKMRTEDYDLFLSLLKNNDEIQFISKPLTWLRRDNHGNESSKWQYILYGRTALLKKHWKTLYKANGFMSILIFIQKTFLMAGWRAKRPLSYLFKLLSFVLPKEK